MCKIWTLALILSVVTGWAASQSPSNAHVPQPIVSTTANNPANLTCDSHGQPLSVCLWRSPAANVINILGTAQDGQATAVPGISYAGDGLNSGKCGLKIESIKDADSGRWECTLIAQSGGTLFTGTVDVNILKKPGKPQFDSDLGSMNDGDQKAITCFSANGQPTPTFQWFIDEDPVDEKELQPISNKTDGGLLYTYQIFNHKFTWQDSGKKLRCVIVSEALGKDDEKEIAQPINVYYAPKSSEEEVTIRVPELGTQAVLSINISSNPEPTIQWMAGKQTVIGGRKSQDQRIEARMPKLVGPDLYLCELVVNKVEEEDLNVVYKLIAQNQKGTGQFELRLSSAAEASTGLSAGGIVGLVLGIPLLLILIALIVVYTRAKGLLCFKGDDGTSSEKERMGEDGDSNKGGNEEKPTISSRITAVVENLLARKKDKTAPADEEASKPQEKEKDAPGGNNEEKKPDDIVYAELDIARGGTEGAPQPVIVRGSDEKTEYAEIVGVIPPAQVQEEKEKKSPSGSKNTSPKK